MRTLRQRGWASTALALSATLFLLGSFPLHAEEKITSKPSSSALGAALQMTRTRGVATVAVLTSSEQPSSIRFWNEFNDGAWARTNRGLVQVVNVSKDAEPGLIRTMGALRFPTVIVYARGPRGVTHLGTIADCDTAEALVERLRSLDLGVNPPAKADQAVSQTAFGGDTYPSQQASPPPASYCPPVTAAPQPQLVAPTLSLTPTVPQTITTTASLVQVPSQSLMISQAPPQVFLAPSQAPVVYVPQTLSAGPSGPAQTLMLSSGSPASQPTGNLFLSSPTLALSSAAPAPPLTAGLPTPLNVSVAPAQATLAAGPPAGAAVATLASGPPAALANVTNQTLSLPTSGARTRVRVRGPGMLASSLSRFGERLTRLGRTRIETLQETTLEAPVTQSPGAGVATLSTTSMSPVAQQPTLTLSAGPQPPCASPPCAPPAPPSGPVQPQNPTLPTPQATWARGPGHN